MSLLFTQLEYIRSTIAPSPPFLKTDKQWVFADNLQHKAELTFQDQPVDLFFYRQAFERCVAT